MMFAGAPEIDDAFTVEWDEELWREGQKKRRRARRRLGKPAQIAKLRNALFEKQNGRCCFCCRQMTDGQRVRGEPVPHEQVTLEHLISHADGGETSEENCRAACFLCNGLKGQLEQSIRSLELAMQSSLTHEVHYYAERLRRALAAWENRITKSPTKEGTGAANNCTRTD